MSTIFWALFYCPQTLTRSSSWLWMELKMFFGCSMNSVFGLETACPSRAPGNELNVCLPQNLLTWPIVRLMSHPPGQGVRTRKVRSLRTDGHSIRGWPSGSWLTQKSPTCTYSGSVPWTLGAACSRYLSWGHTQPVFLGAKVGPRFRHLTSVPEAALMEGKAWWLWSSLDVILILPFIGYETFSKA